MSADQSKATVSRFYEELWNNRTLSVADEIFAAESVTHQLHSGAEVVGVPRGPEAVKHHVLDWLNGFPDLHFTVEQMVAEEEQVVTRCLMRGTHTGNWLGIAPTGKQLSIRMIVIQRVVTGKIIEDWVLVEALGFFQQLGLVSSTQNLLAKAPE